jgi:hypothetical protein
LDWDPHSRPSPTGVGEGRFVRKMVRDHFPKDRMEWFR